ncbi:MAG: sigma-54-dependent transcriptional regulator [Candidatus Binatia bacterium]
MSPPPASRVLLVDDEPDFRAVICDELRDRGYGVASFGSGHEALRVAGEQDFDVALLDLKMAGLNGLELLRALKELDPSIEVVMLTAHASVDTAVQAIKLGALDYLSKPVRLSELEITLNKALEVRQLRRETQRLRAGLRHQQGFEEIVGHSKRMRAVFEHIESVAASDASVLVEGESGTGKELVAKAIHRRSARGERPFVVLNCGTLTDSLLESDLFGHEKGAFTGATSPKTGLVEVADGGTLFVDEVAEMSLGSQSRFLRVLESGELRRVGSTRTLTVNLRVVAATNRHLEREVEKGRFREDLFYRLNVYRIELPPLRERREDIPLLVEYFLSRSSLHRGAARTVTPQALEVLLDHQWPGNVRELANVVERAIIASHGEPIRPEHLLLTPRPVTGPAAGPTEGLQPLSNIERAHIEHVLAAVSGNKRRAARILGISLRNLYRKLERYGLPGAADPSGTSPEDGA